MNYLDVGLPHTEYFPKRTAFCPPRSIPMSGLSRKYMGLEPVSKTEIDATINRLSQPKKTRNSEASANSSKDTGRFVGGKRMSTTQISNMVARLCSRRQPKDTDGGGDDANDAKAATIKSAKERENRMLRNEEATSQWRKVPSVNIVLEDGKVVDRKDSVKPNIDRANTELNILKPKQDISVRSASSFGRESGLPCNDTGSSSKERVVQLVTRQDSLKGKDSQPAIVDIPDSQKTAGVLIPSVHINTYPETSKVAKGELFVPKDALKLDKSPRAAFDRSETINLEVVDRLWGDNSDVAVVSRLRVLGGRRSTKSASRAPRKPKRKVAKLDDARPATSKAESRARHPIPCDDQLIHRVASINRSPRPDQSWT